MTFVEIMNNGFFGGTQERPQHLQTVVWFMIICAIIGYFLGSINWGVILSRKYGDDVRKHGSGNAGATNMMRTYGKKAGAKTDKGGAIVICGSFFIAGEAIGILESEDEAE